MVVAGREAELVGVESLVGLCINTIPVRIALPAQEPVQTWLRQLHEQLATLQRYSYYPLWQIQGLSELGAGQSLFQSILTFENYPIEQTLQQVQRSDLHLQSIEAQERTNYPLSAIVLPGEQVELLLSYQEQALEAELVSSMLDLWQQVLQTLVQQPEQSLAALPLVSETERALLLDRWNATERLYPQDVCVHELFEQQAQRQPEAIALVEGEAQLTYRQLNARANQLAHHLQRLGVGPEVMVGLWVQRSPELIVGLLGILKAGGVYVPLDPQSPRERLAFLLADTQMPVLLTQQQLLPRLPEYQGQLLCLDRDWETISGQSQANPLTGITGGNLAYAIYTSGSTGQPKGVLIAHQALAAFCGSVIQAYELRAEDRVLQFSTFTFDVSLEQILPSLLVGARLVLRGSEGWSSAQLRQ